MKLYWTTTTELVKAEPEIFCHNLDGEGMFIGVPGTLIFRNKREALDAIARAKKCIEMNMKAAEGENHES